MNVLISGASIAGPTLGWFLQERGFDVTIVERAPSLRRGGYAIDIRGKALDVIERMGLRDALRPLETDTLSTSMIDARGKSFGRMPRGFGVIDEGDVEILRGDLASILYEATRTKVQYVFGDSIASIRQTDDDVHVVFESGEIGKWDLVVGADGVHSRVRDRVFGTEESFRRDLGGAIAIFTAPNHLGLDRQQLLFQNVRRIGSVKAANANREIKVFLIFPIAETSEFDPDNVATQKRLTREAFVDQGWEFPQLLDAMEVAPDFYCDRTCQIVMDRFTKGRVALVGDAAYCPSPLAGQGTSLALVGACVLADRLAKESVPTAFASYDALLRPFAIRNQAIATKIGGFAQTPFEMWSRNLAMRVFPYLPGKDFIMKMAMREIAVASRDIALT